MALSKTQLLTLFAVLVICFFYFDWQQYLSLSELKTRQQAIEAYRDNNPLITLIIYSLTYIIVTALSWPGATVLTLAGGALFGLFWGAVIVSFASTIGATLAFLATRFLFRDNIEQRFGSWLKTVNEGIAKEGSYYLFTLRLVPFIPFFVINVVMGLTTMKTSTFYWVSQVGMLAGTILYVNAGTQLANINSVSDIASPVMIGSFVLLGIFPLATKKIVAYFRSSQAQE